MKSAEQMIEIAILRLLIYEKLPICEKSAIICVNCKHCSMQMPRQSSFSKGQILHSRSNICITFLRDMKGQIILVIPRRWMGAVITSKRKT